MNFLSSKGRRGKKGMAFSSYGLSSMWCASSSPRVPPAGRGPYHKISRLSIHTSTGFQRLKKRPDESDGQHQRPAVSVSFGSSPSSFNSLLRPQPGLGSGGGGGDNNNNGNDQNPFNSGEGWRGGSPYSSLVFLILPFFFRRFRFSLLDTGKGALLALLSLLGCFCHSQSALARSASDGVWEVRGGKWTRVVCDHSNDAFLLADPLKAAATGSSFIFSPWRVFLGLMLPEGYPHSVSSDYLEYSLWRGVQGVASQISGVLATQALLYAVGLGRGAIPTAAAVNWVLKDGIGYLSKIFLSKFGRHFDVNPKGWRLFADLLENIAYGLELLTPAFPCHFVLIGAAAGAGRSAAALIQAATRSCFYAGFAAQRNFAEVIAKGEAQGMVSKSLGIMLGIVLANHIGSSTPLAISTFIIIASIHMFCNLKSYQSIQLRTLNPYRASLVFSEYLLSGQVPPVEEVNNAEPLFPKLALFSADHMHKVQQVLSAEAKDAAAQIEQRLQIGSRLSEVICSKEDALALFDLFGDEGYMLTEHEGSFCVLLREKSSPHDMLKSLFHVNYLYWLERNVGIKSRGAVSDCMLGGKLQISLDYVQREFNHIKYDGQLAGWVTEGLIARPLPNRICPGQTTSAQ